MPLKDNKEYAKRFRLKKKLKDLADKIFRTWELGKSRSSSHTPREIKTALDNIINLPYNWTEEDYKQAKLSLSTYRTNIFLENDTDLQQDISATRTDKQEAKKATDKMKKAYTAMLQTLELATDDPVDEAAAILQVARFVARRLAKEKEQIPENDATAYCLATLPRSYQKPDWVKPHITNMIDFNCVEIKIIHGAPL